MKAPSKFGVSVCVRAAVLAGMGLAGVSCALPPREAWQRVKDEGILTALFVPKRTVLPGDTTQRLAGADLSIEAEGIVNRAGGMPVGMVSEQPGYVYSPRTSPRKLVNVKSFAAGQTVLCPYTLEPFMLPGAVVAPESQRLAEGRFDPLGAANAEVFGPDQPPLPTTNVASLPMDDPALDNPAVQELTPDPGPSEENGAASSGPVTPLLVSPSSAPFASWVDGKPGHVYSPFAARHQLVDVAGIPTGAEVFCPFSGRIFRVPAPIGLDDLVGPPLPEPVSTVPTSPEIAATLPGEIGPPDSAVAAAPPTPDHSGETVTRTPTTSKYGAAQPQQVPPSPPIASASSVVPVSPATTTGDPKTSTQSPAPIPKSTPIPDLTPPLPTAAWAPNKPGLVQSPFGKPGELVDVTGKPSGSRVICPYSQKPFLVPAP